MRRWSILLVALLLANPAAQANSKRHNVTGRVDLTLVGANSDEASWLHGGAGKLRFDDAHDGLRVSRAFLEYRGQLGPGWLAHATINAHDRIEEKIDITEAFLEWRPLPKSAWRLRSRLGFFYPRLSLENSAAGWSNRYALSSSAINTWIGEEIRTLGLEGRVIREFPRWPDHHFSVEAAAFYGNDPTGALLAWRGWSAHDRQTGISGRIPLPQVSAIEAWAPSGNPPPSFKPFKEVDHKLGYYAGAEWRWRKRFMLRYQRYDNHADPEAVSGNDAAWETDYHHLGAQLALPLKFGLLGQWIKGSTVTGPDLGPWRVQDLDFQSHFLLLTRKFAQHRLTGRYEWFDLQPFNDPIGITNQDKGNALTIAWLYTPTKKLQIGAEYLQIASDRCRTDVCFWVFQGQPRTMRESQLQLGIRWFFLGEAPG